MPGSLTVSLSEISAGGTEKMLRLRRAINYYSFASHSPCYGKPLKLLSRLFSVQTSGDIVAIESFFASYSRIGLFERGMISDSSSMVNSVQTFVLRDSLLLA